jgi:hypothetical protein
VKFLIVLLSFGLLSLAHAQESNLRSRLRDFLNNIAGEQWSERLLGKAPVAEPEVQLPEIPKQLKKSTDLSTYEKQTKDSTEFERLPLERRRQFDFKFLQELFAVTRKAEARDEDLANWLNTLDQGGSREGIYQALVLDEVYSALENMEERPSQKLLDFTVTTYQQFMGQNMTVDSLARFNLYTLKRILTERGLDLMEYYESRDLDSLYRWYAVFSGKLAQNYGQMLSSPVRTEASMAYHYQWAKEMPVQHIKSEFIIKLHTVMNGLQQLQ